MNTVNFQLSVVRLDDIRALFPSHDYVMKGHSVVSFENLSTAQVDKLITDVAAFSLRKQGFGDFHIVGRYDNGNITFKRQQL